VSDRRPLEGGRTPLFDLTHKVALVTGAGSSRVFARGLAAAGAQLVCADRDLKRSARRVPGDARRPTGDTGGGRRLDRRLRRGQAGASKAASTPSASSISAAV